LKTGDSVEVVFDDYFKGNEYKPDLKLGETKKILGTHTCKCGELHLNVGLLSDINYVSCYKCGEHLPNGNFIHWAHSSRFSLIENADESETITTKQDEKEYELIYD